MTSTKAASEGSSVSSRSRPLLPGGSPLASIARKKSRSSSPTRHNRTSKSSLGSDISSNKDILSQKEESPLPTIEGSVAMTTTISAKDEKGEALKVAFKPAHVDSEVNEKPSSPQEVQPSSPQEVQPSSPQEVQPRSPQEVQPRSPQEVKPSSPQEVKPSSPQEVKPSSPQEVKPSSPQEVQPRSPQEVKPSGPQEVKPSSPQEVNEQSPIPDIVVDPSSSISLEPSQDASVTQEVHASVSTDLLTLTFKETIGSCCLVLFYRVLPELRALPVYTALLSRRETTPLLEKCCLEWSTGMDSS